MKSLPQTRSKLVETRNSTFFLHSTIYTVTGCLYVEIVTIFEIPSQNGGNKKFNIFGLITVRRDSPTKPIFELNSSQKIKKTLMKAECRNNSDPFQSNHGRAGGQTTHSHKRVSFTPL